MKRNFLVIAILFMVVLFVSWTAVPSFACMFKTWPANTGVRMNSSEPIPTYLAGAILNPSATQRLNLNFPIIRENGKEIVYTKVWVVDENPTDNIRCGAASVYWYASDGESCYFIDCEVIYSSGASPSPQVLNFTKELYTPFDSSRLIFCRIPKEYNGKRSKVLSYQVGEI